MGSPFLQIGAGVTRGLVAKRQQDEQRALDEKSRKRQAELQKQKNVIAGTKALSDFATAQGIQLTPQQFQLFARNLSSQIGIGAVGDFERAEPSGFRTLTPEETAAAGFREGTVVQQAPTGQFDVAQKPETAGRASGKTFTQTAKLRGEFLKLSDNFIKQRDSFGQIQAAAQNPSAAGDIALIFSFMKMLDPTSVVREGEQATAANARGVPEATRTLYNRLIAGERLGANQRQDFVNRADILFQDLSKQQAQRKSEFQRLARSAGVRPSDVTIDIGFAKSRTVPAAAVAPKVTAPVPLTDDLEFTKKANQFLLESGR